MPVYGGKVFGCVPYGDIQELTAKPRKPFAASYGDAPSGLQAFGGSSIPADQTIGAVTEQKPVISGAITAEYLAPAAVSYGDIPNGGYGGSNAAVTQVSFSLTEPAPSVSATSTTSSMGGTFTEPLPVVAGAVSSQALMHGAVTEPVPSVTAGMAVDLNIALTEPNPTVTGSILPGGVFAATTTEPNASVSAAAIQTPGLYAAIVEQKPTLSGILTIMQFASGDITAPKPSVSADFLSPTSTSATITEPAPSVSGQFNDNAYIITEPSPAVSSDVVAGNVLQGDMQEQLASVAATFFGEQTAQGSITEQKPVVSGSFSTGAQITGAVTEHKPAVSSVTVRGAIVSGNVIDITPILNANIIAQGLIAGSITEPSATLNGVISNVASVVISQTDISAVVMNTETMAVTEYTNYQFKGLSSVGGKLYGIKDDGIYLLEGADDNGVAILSEILTGQTDLEQDRLKRVPLIHAESTGIDTITVSADGTDYDIPFNGRAKPGRGLRANKLAFGAKSTSHMEIESIEPTIEVLKKRAI